MYCYAELNGDKICFSVKNVLEPMTGDNLIEISDENKLDYLNRKYENGAWSEEKFLHDAGAIQLSRMEMLEKSQADQDEIIMQLMLGGM